VEDNRATALEVFMTYLAQFYWKSAARSHVGLVRSVNEDTCLAQPERGIWAVADGMGGHTLGDFASASVIEALDTMPSADSLDRLVDETRKRLQIVNRQLREEAVARGVSIIGSTIVVLLAFEDRCACLWAGDSRIYLHRDGMLRRITRDHSHVEEMRARGDILDEALAVHPARNLITRAVGAMGTLDLEEEIVEVRENDLFLLCSDGLSNEVGDAEMEQVMRTAGCSRIADTLISLALAHGGRDNISVVTAHAEDAHPEEKTALNPAL
jgi:protein phosphatase